MASLGRSAPRPPVAGPGPPILPRRCSSPCTPTLSPSSFLPQTTLHPGPSAVPLGGGGGEAPRGCPGGGRGRGGGMTSPSRHGASPEHPQPISPSGGMNPDGRMLSTWKGSTHGCWGRPGPAGGDKSVAAPGGGAGGVSAAGGRWGEPSRRLLNLGEGSSSGYGAALGVKGERQEEKSLTSFQPLPSKTLLVRGPAPPAPPPRPRGRGGGGTRRGVAPVVRPWEAPSPP